MPHRAAIMSANEMRPVLLARGVKVARGSGGGRGLDSIQLTAELGFRSATGEPSSAPLGVDEATAVAIARLLPPDRRVIESDFERSARRAAPIAVGAPAGSRARGGGAHFPGEVRSL